MARFCMVTTFYPPFNFGGDGIAIRELAQALVRRGHHVTVVHDVNTYAALAGHQPAPAGEERGVEVVSVRSRVGAIAPLATHQTGRAIFTQHELRSLLRSGGFDFPAAVQQKRAVRELSHLLAGSGLGCEKGGQRKGERDRSDFHSSSE